MDTTIFLAQVWGPTILAVAVGIFVSRAYYLKIYRDLEQNSLSVLVFGMIAMVAGIVQVLAHNVWETFPQIVVSFLGWALLLKGLLFLVAPGFVDRAGDKWVSLKMIPLAGIISLVIGVYLTWFGFIA